MSELHRGTPRYTAHPARRRTRTRGRLIELDRATLDARRGPRARGFAGAGTLVPRTSVPACTRAGDYAHLSDWNTKRFLLLFDMLEELGLITGA